MDSYLAGQITYSWWLRSIQWTVNWERMYCSQSVPYLRLQCSNNKRGRVAELTNGIDAMRSSWMERRFMPKLLCSAETRDVDTIWNKWAYDKVTTACAASCLHHTKYFPKIACKLQLRHNIFQPTLVTSVGQIIPEVIIIIIVRFMKRHMRSYYTGVP